MRKKWWIIPIDRGEVGGGCINGWECAKSDGDEMRKVNEPAKKMKRVHYSTTKRGMRRRRNKPGIVYRNGDGRVVRTG